MSLRCVMKVDLHKDYGFIEWDCLRFTLADFGLLLTFINWVMEYITFVSYSLMVNGSLTEPFQGKKGIR